MVDLIFVTTEIMSAWQSKVTKSLENGSVSVVSLEGLIKLKTLSGRLQDKADIKKLMELENES